MHRVTPLIRVEKKLLLYTDSICFNIKDPGPLVISIPLSEVNQKLQYMDIVYFFIEDKEDKSTRAFNGDVQFINERHSLSIYMINCNGPLASNQPTEWKTDETQFSLCTFISNVFLAADDRKTILMTVSLYQEY